MHPSVFCTFLLCLVAVIENKPFQKEESAWSIIASSNKRANVDGSDMIFNGERLGSSRSRKRRANVNYDTVTFWPDGEIPYYFEENFPYPYRSNIENVMSTIESETCIDFRKYEWYDTSKPTDSVEIRNDNNTGCAASVGKQSSNYVTLQDTCILSDETVTHELLHVIGFGHEIQRPDRNETMTVNKTNIEDDAWAQVYQIDTTVSFSTDHPYDPNSLMHITGYAHAKDTSLKTSWITNDPSADTGSTTMSTGDISAINDDYDCPSK